MVDLSDTDAALARGARAVEPRASAARYDRESDHVVVDLTNGCIFAFPPKLAQGLGAATASQLAEVEILGAGDGLHWDKLDVDMSIQGILAGLFGTQTFMARRAGKATSPAKAAAARSNGAKGGRPPKAAFV